jgi:long-chain acyl-CoA synthetase
MTHFALKQSESAGDQDALIDERGALAWTELNARSNQLIAAFHELGLESGDTIALFAGNCREYYEIMLAATHAGIVYVPVNWHFSAEELAYVVANSDARVLFVENQFSDVASAALARNETPGLTHTVEIRGDTDGMLAYETLLAGQSTAEPEQQTLGGPMFYTSGTTGRPKGVKSSTFAAGGPIELMELIGGGLSQMLSIPADGRTLICGPAYHSAQWAFSFLPLIAGSSVLMRHRFDPEETLQLIDEFKVTNVHLVPTQFHRLLKIPESARSGFDGGSLDVVWHGAAPCPQETKRRMIDWWGPVIHEYYGSTEGSIVTQARAEDWLERPGTVGQPAATVEITIRDEDGKELPVGESGQIYVKSLMGSDFEYHNEPDKTADVHLEPGVFTFGDVGYFDEDGFLYLTDRKIDMIISGGVNIYPAEIEAVLQQHPAIEDAAVFGVPNEEFGEEVKAAVKLMPGEAADETMSEQLISFCREHLAHYKAPRSIDFEEEFPRHETGKLYKRLLRDRYWQDSSRKI